ncbi:MAG: WD40 repeat domain-containing protein [Fuerstiella sp.]
MWMSAFPTRPCLTQRWSGHLALAMIGLMLTVGSVAVSAAGPEAFEPPVTCLCISADGEYVVDGSQAGIRIRRWHDLAVEAEHPIPCAQIHDCRISADQSRLVVVGGDPGQTSFVGVYAWPDVSEIWSRQFGEDVLYAGSFAQSGDVLALAGHDHGVYLVNADNGEPQSILRGHSKPATDVRILNDSRTLLSCSIDQTIRVWNYQTGSIVRSLNNHTQPVIAMAVRPVTEGLPMIASVGEDRTVRLWQPTIGRLVRFCRLKSPANALTWTNTGDRIIAGCRDGCVYSIVADTLEVRTYPDISSGWVNSIAAHPKQSSIVVGTSTGRVRKILLDH